MTLNIKRKGKWKLKNLEVFINFDGTLQNATCSRIAEEILKYVLYQRHTIPVQFEGLTRELTKLQKKLISEDTAEASENENDDKPSELTPEDFCKPKVYRTRDEIVKRKEKKLQRRRLDLFSRLVDSYRRAVKVMQQEIESGDVSAVCFILGNTIFSAKEAFLIYLPDDFEDHSNLTDRKAIVHLFRNLVTNEDLLHFVSQPCQNQKLWIMVQKRNTENNDCFSEESVRKEEESGILLPRPEYCFPTRTRAVHIWMSCNKIRGPEGTIDEMVLTPCADSSDLLESRSFPAGCSRVRKTSNTEESVKFTCNKSGSRPLKRESICRLILESDNEPRSDTAEFKTPYKSAKCAFKTPARPRNLTSVAGTPSHSHGICSLVETPNLSRIYNGSEQIPAHSEFVGSHFTPGQGADETASVTESLCRLPRSPLIYSPVKSLANTINHFSISTGENNEEYTEKSEPYIWFQVQDPILGFKNSRC